MQLIAWRVRCSISALKVQLARDSKKREEAKALEQSKSSWWSRFGSREQETTTILEVAAHEEVLSAGEMEFLQQTLTENAQSTDMENEEAFTLSSSDMKWSFSVGLGSFTFLLEEADRDSEGHVRSQDEFMKVVFDGLNLTLLLEPKVDHDLREVFQWTFHAGLRNLSASQHGNRLVYFQNHSNALSQQTTPTHSFHRNDLQVEGQNVGGDGRDGTLAGNGTREDDGQIDGSRAPTDSDLHRFATIKDSGEFDFSDDLKSLDVRSQDPELRSVDAKSDLDDTASFHADYNFVDVANLVGKDKHRLVLGSRLKPVVLKIRPLMLRQFIKFFTFEASEEFRDEMERVKNIRAGLGDGGFADEFVAEQREKLVARVLEEQQQIDSRGHLSGDRSQSTEYVEAVSGYKDVSIHVELSAPILIFEDADIGTLKFYLGSAKITTPEPCVWSNMQLTCQLKDTQLRYLQFTPGGGETQAQQKTALHPIPLTLAIHVQKLKQIKVHAISEVIRMEVDPTLVYLSQAIPTALIKELTTKPTIILPKEDPFDPITPTPSDAREPTDVSVTTEGDTINDMLRSVEGDDSHDQSVKFDFIEVDWRVAEVSLCASDEKRAITQLTASELSGVYRLEGDGESITRFVMQDLQIADRVTKQKLLSTEAAPAYGRAGTQFFSDALEEQEPSGAIKVFYWSNAKGCSQKHRPNFAAHTDMLLGGLTETDAWLAIDTAAVEASWHKESVERFLQLQELYDQKWAAHPADPSPMWLGVDDVDEGDHAAVPKQEKVELSKTVAPDFMESMPDFVGGITHLSLGVRLRVTGLALSLYEHDRVFSRIGVEDLTCAHIVVNERGESHTWVSIDRAEVAVNGNVVLAPRDRDDTLLRMELRNYAPDLHAPLTGCLRVQLAPFVYVYYQQDLSSLMKYISGSVLGAVVRKSYEAAKEIAQESQFAYRFLVNSPLFILSEDKSAVPQVYYSDLYLAGSTTTGSREYKGRGGFRSVHVYRQYGEASYEDVERVRQHLRQAYQDDAHPGVDTGAVVDTYYLGSYISLKTGDITFWNETDPDETSSYCTVEKLQGEAHAHSNGSFGREISGCLLQPTDLHMRLHWTPETPVYVDAIASPLHLALTRPQLTLVLDVLCENLSGGGFLPTPVSLQQATMSVDQTAQIKKSLEEPPMRVSVRLGAPLISLRCLQSVQVPLCYFEFSDLYIACDAGLYLACM